MVQQIRQQFDELQTQYLQLQSVVVQMSIHSIDEETAAHWREHLNVGKTSPL
jgi:hypothetical protein